MKTPRICYGADTAAAPAVSKQRLANRIQSAADAADTAAKMKTSTPTQPITVLNRLLKTEKNVAVVRHDLCPQCGEQGVRSGARKTGRGRVQRFRCRTCGRYFCSSSLPRKQHTAAVIVEAVTAYNLGRTIAETKAHLARRLRVSVAASTIHSWLGHFAPVCTFHRYRRRYSFAEDETIQTRTFSHKQEYKFKFHRLKTNIFCKRLFPQIRRYLWHIADHCPHELFQRSDGARCSDGDLPELRLRLVRKDTNAAPLAKLGLVLAKTRRGRHEAVQRFMLANDSATVAVEVPVYLFPNEAPDLNLAAPLTGHIDVLQVRYGKVWILDYKPDARKETRAKYQLYLYARALSARTKIPLHRFGLAYFDDADYFEVGLEPQARRLAA